MIVFLPKVKLKNYVQYQILILENLGLCRFVLVGFLLLPQHSAIVSVILIKRQRGQPSRSASLQ